MLSLINMPLTDGQFDALVALTFNLGTGALQLSRLRRKNNREEYEDAAREIGERVWAGSRRLNGPINRRKAEVALFFIRTCVRIISLGYPPASPVVTDL